MPCKQQRHPSEFASSSHDPCSLHHGPAPMLPAPQEAAGGDAAASMARLGALMDASHASCSKLYECSCQELDTLVGVAKGAGAIGSRLTGGCSRGGTPQDAQVARGEAPLGPGS